MTYAQTLYLCACTDGWVVVSASLRVSSGVPFAWAEAGTHAPIPLEGKTCTCVHAVEAFPGEAGLLHGHGLEHRGGVDGGDESGGEEDQGDEGDEALHRRLRHIEVERPERQAQGGGAPDARELVLRHAPRAAGGAHEAGVELQAEARPGPGAEGGHAGALLPAGLLHHSAQLHEVAVGCWSCEGRVNTCNHRATV